jgi:hypothetical protein
MKARFKSGVLDGQTRGEWDDPPWPRIYVRRDDPEEIIFGTEESVSEHAGEDFDVYEFVGMGVGGDVSLYELMEAATDAGVGDEEGER